MVSGPISFCRGPKRPPRNRFIKSVPCKCDMQIFTVFRECVYMYSGYICMYNSHKSITMRFYNTSKELKAYAVSGTQTVLLAMDIPQSKVKGGSFHGFKISRKEGNKKPILLNGSKRFASDNPDNPVQSSAPCNHIYGKTIPLTRVNRIPIPLRRCLAPGMICSQNIVPHSK